MTIAEAQKQVDDWIKTYGVKYFSELTNMAVLTEEVGELARSLNTGEPNSAEERAEFADVFAWLASLASLRGVDLSACVRDKYGSGCPRCQGTPCSCQHRREGDQ